MAESIQDHHEPFPISDNLWFKNYTAHKMMRSKHSNSKEYCSYCRNHRCFDPTRVSGNRSLKKSKVVSYKTTKYADKLVVSVDFVNIKNGEIILEDNV